MIVSQRVVEQQCDKIWNSYCKAQKTEGDKEADRERGGCGEWEWSTIAKHQEGRENRTETTKENQNQASQISQQFFVSLTRSSLCVFYANSLGFLGLINENMFVLTFWKLSLMVSTKRLIHWFALPCLLGFLVWGKGDLQKVWKLMNIYHLSVKTRWVSHLMSMTSP